MNESRQGIGSMAVEKVRKHWLDIVAGIVTIAALVVPAILWAGQQKIAAIVEPLKAQVQGIDDKVCNMSSEFASFQQRQQTHAATPGHPVMVERVDNLSEDLAEIKRDIKTILERTE